MSTWYRELPKINDKAINEIKSKNQKLITDIFSKVKSDLQNEWSSLSYNLRDISSKGHNEYRHIRLTIPKCEIYGQQYLCNNLATKLNEEFSNYLKFHCRNGDLYISW